jgi:hypothetical protein
VVAVRRYEAIRSDLGTDTRMERRIAGRLAQRGRVPERLNQRMAHDIAQGDLVPMHWLHRRLAGRGCASRYTTDNSSGVGTVA